jgi:C-methyltransferase C-terminal domain/Putative zinc binding domain
MSEVTCRACRSRNGQLVLDLGEQPACDYFPRCGDEGPDPVYPLQMWLCASCGLAQLAADATVPEEPRGIEPAALVSQAADAVARVAAAELLPAGATVAEYGSPHGGSWLGLLAGRGVTPVPDAAPADVVLDCFGLMHAADQRAAIAERADRVAAGGTLLLQYHALQAITGHGQWNALRHGHYAYYSAAALAAMLRPHGFRLSQAWHFALYGGTVLLAARRDRGSPGDADLGEAGPSSSVQALLAAEEQAGVRDPAVLCGLQRSALDQAKHLHDWLAACHSAGRTVIGYGAASRAVSLLRRAGVDRSLLPAVADASPAKRGRRMPGSDIPVVAPGELAARRPDAVLLLLSDLLPEVRAAYPEVEAAGGRWVDVATLGAGPGGAG